MSWVILVLSGLLEAVWATALGKSEGFTRLWPSVIFAVTLIGSMAGLAWAMRDSVEQVVQLPDNKARHWLTRMRP